MTPTTGIPTTDDMPSRIAADFVAALRTMHGPTRCLSSTISTLVPTPLAVQAPKAAWVTELSLRLTPSGQQKAQAWTRTHFSTAASPQETMAFYQTFTPDQASEITTILDPDKACVQIHAQLTDPHETRMVANVQAAGWRTTVTVETTMNPCPTGTNMHEIAGWHGFDLPQANQSLTQVDVCTMPAAHTVPQTAVLTSRYRFNDVSRPRLRSFLEQQLTDRDWTYTERFEDILEPIANFGAELCIDGSDGWSELTILGEFAMDR